MHIYAYMYAYLCINDGAIHLIYKHLIVSTAYSTTALPAGATKHGLVPVSPYMFSRSLRYAHAIGPLVYSMWNTLEELEIIAGKVAPPGVRREQRPPPLQITPSQN